MNTPTIEEVKNHFKNAESIICLQDKALISLSKIEIKRDIHFAFGCYWIDFSINEKNRSINLWDRKQLKYAEIVKTKDDLSIYEKALNKWGVTSQIGMMQEECIELALAIRKMERNGGGEGLEDVIDEIADVTIMTRQMELVPGWKEKIDERIAFKLGRLNNRIKNS